jgi:hypothetical protein
MSFWGSGSDERSSPDEIADKGLVRRDEIYPVMAQLIRIENAI